MKLRTLRIENLRSFKDETIKFDDYTCLIGENGAGKSTVFFALNVLFRDSSGSRLSTSDLEEEDFHQKNTDLPIRVTAEFGGLTDEAREDFSDYVRGDKLVISAEATFNPLSGTAPVKQYGQRNGFEDFREFFERRKEKAKAPELKTIYAGLVERHAGLPKAGSMDDMATALREYEGERPEDCVLIPSEDQFYGFTRGVNRLAKHFQWVFIPAVKDAGEEQSEAKDTALGKLLARTVRQRVEFADSLDAIQSQAVESYLELLEDKQGALRDLSASLSAGLQEWAHPDAQLALRWQHDPEKSVRIEDPAAGVDLGEGSFSGNLARFGHGIQRSFLFALLRELSQGVDGGDSPFLLLAIEEPELYQHPPQARHLAAVLEQLAGKDAQVAVCTHSPIFVSGEAFGRVRMVRKSRETGETSVVGAEPAVVLEELKRARQGGGFGSGPAGVIAKLQPTLQPELNEMFFASKVVLVEGLEDLAYITTHLHLSGRWDVFRAGGAHIVPCHGKDRILRPLAVAKSLGIPVFVAWDADGDEANPEKRNMHDLDNTAILALLGVKDAEPFPSDTVWQDDYALWDSNITEAVKRDLGCDWEPHREEARRKYDHAGNLSKNPLFIADALERAWNGGLRSGTLEQLCERIISFVGRETEPLENSTEATAT